MFVQLIVFLKEMKPFVKMYSLYCLQEAATHYTNISQANKLTNITKLNCSICVTQPLGLKNNKTCFFNSIAMCQQAIRFAVMMAESVHCWVHRDSYSRKDKREEENGGFRGAQALLCVRSAIWNSLQM